MSAIDVAIGGRDTIAALAPDAGVGPIDDAGAFGAAARVTRRRGLGVAPAKELLQEQLPPPGCCRGLSSRRQNLRDDRRFLFGRQAPVPARAGQQRNPLKPNLRFVPNSIHTDNAKPLASGSMLEFAAGEWPPGTAYDALRLPPKRVAGQVPQSAAYAAEHAALSGQALR